MLNKRYVYFVFASKNKNIYWCFTIIGRIFVPDAALTKSLLLNNDLFLPSTVHLCGIRKHMDYEFYLIYIYMYLYLLSLNREYKSKKNFWNGIGELHANICIGSRHSSHGWKSPGQRRCVNWGFWRNVIAAQEVIYSRKHKDFYEEPGG